MSLLKYSFPSLALVGCAVVFGLSGCVAAIPLGQMAVQRMPPVNTPCAAGTGCTGATTSSSFGNLSNGMTDSFHALAGGTPNPQTAAAAPKPN